MERQLADPALYTRPEESRRVGSEHRKLENMFRDFADWKKALADIESNKELIAVEEDAEMRALAEEDLAQQQARAAQLEKALQIAMEATAKEIETLLSDHVAAMQETFRSYDPEAYRIAQQAVLERDGGMVVMLISPDAQTMLGILHGVNP